MFSLQHMPPPGREMKETFDVSSWVHKSRALPHAVIHACSHWTLHPASSHWTGGLTGIRGLVHFGWRWGEKDFLYVDFDVLNFLFFKLKLLPSGEAQRAEFVMHSPTAAFSIGQGSTPGTSQSVWHITGAQQVVGKWCNENFTLKTSHLDKINSLLTVPVLSTFAPLNPFSTKEPKWSLKKKKNQVLKLDHSDGCWTVNILKTIEMQVG